MNTDNRGNSQDFIPASKGPYLPSSALSDATYTPPAYDMVIIDEHDVPIAGPQGDVIPGLELLAQTRLWFGGGGGAASTSRLSDSPVTSMKDFLTSITARGREISSAVSQAVADKLNWLPPFSLKYAPAYARTIGRLLSSAEAVAKTQGQGASLGDIVRSCNGDVVPIVDDATALSLLGDGYMTVEQWEDLKGQSLLRWMRGRSDAELATMQVDQGDVVHWVRKKIIAALPSTSKVKAAISKLASRMPISRAAAALKRKVVETALAKVAVPTMMAEPLVAQLRRVMTKLHAQRAIYDVRLWSRQGTRIADALAYVSLVARYLPKDCYSRYPFLEDYGVPFLLSLIWKETAFKRNTLSKDGHASTGYLQITAANQQSLLQHPIVAGRPMSDNLDVQARYTAAYIDRKMKQVFIAGNIADPEVRSFMMELPPKWQPAAMFALRWNAGFRSDPVWKGGRYSFNTNRYVPSVLLQMAAFMLLLPRSAWGVRQ